MSNENDNNVQSSDRNPSKKIQTEVELLQELTMLVDEYQDYDSPRVRSDGDIIIPLNSDLKRNRRALQSLADAVKFMMDRDKPKF